MLMKPERLSEEFVQNMLYVLPYWNSRLVRPFKETLNKEMSLETYYCLETVRRCGSVTMTELAGYLKIPKQQVTKLVDKLINCQFVERFFDPGDRRLIRIRLSKSAEDYLEQYYMKNKEFIQGLETTLTETQLQELNQAVRTLLRILPLLN